MSTEVGVGSFSVHIKTSHPENHTVVSFFSMNELEKSTLDMKTLLDNSDDNIEWYSGGDAVWQAQTTNTLKGDSAIESG